ncbi:hypothetical protein [Bradyrhizobium sp. USDA 10063]
MHITIDIDDIVLEKIQTIREREGRPISAIISELLTEALAARRAAGATSPFCWTARPMNALVDISDKETLRARLSDNPID